MGKKYDIDINNDYNYENSSSIKFMRKKTKHRILLLLKSLIYIIATDFISTVVFIIIFNYKYKDLFNNKSIYSYRSNEGYFNAIDNVKNSLVTIGGNKEDLSKNEYIQGNATGIIIQENGRILTNYSVIKDLEEVYVNLPLINSEVLKADIFFINEDNDLAVLQVNSKKALTPIKIASKDNIVEGENILLISNSTSDDYIDNVVPGIITSTNRQLDVNNNKYSLFEVNTPINKFNTGGIISNLNGEVIGIASKKVSDSMNVEGLYYAIDLSSLENVIDDTSELKEILGILEGEFIQVDNGGIYGGLYVTRVDKEGESYKAGLRPTDIIFEIDGKKINSITEVLSMVKNKENGDTVICKVMRAGDVIDMDIVLSNIKK